MGKSCITIILLGHAIAQHSLGWSQAKMFHMTWGVALANSRPSFQAIQSRVSSQLSMCFTPMVQKYYCESLLYISLAGGVPYLYKEGGYLYLNFKIV